MATSTFEDIINDDTPVLIDFYADWCGPCKMQSPILKQLKGDLEDDIKIVKIDVDKNQPLAQSKGISSIPTLHLYNQGKLVWSKTGVAQLTELKKQLHLLKDSTEEE